MVTMLEKPREDVLLSSSLSKVQSTESRPGVQSSETFVTFVRKCHHQCCLREHEQAPINWGILLSHLFVPDLAFSFFFSNRNLWFHVYSLVGLALLGVLNSLGILVSQLFPR